MTIQQFEEICAGAIDDVPEDLRGYLDTVQVVTEALPTLSQRRRIRLRGDKGYPVSDRLTKGDSGLTPSIVTIFRIPLRRDFPDEDELRRQIRRTVFHELAHHFGIDDDQLEAWGAY